MSCDAVAFSAMLWLASAVPSGAASAASAVSAPLAAAPAPVAQEPLFVDIVRRASRLKSEAEAMRKADLAGDIGRGADFAGFKAGIAALADLDMKGHLLLAQRGTDGDLKCILKGISQDLPVKLRDLEAASTAHDRDLALREMTYLLRDNVEVITAPPAPPA